MRRATILPRRATAISLVLLALFVLIAAVVNLPWSLSFMRSRTTIDQVAMVEMEAADIPRAWPATTPHAVPWPTPDRWFEGAVFGCRRFEAFGGVPIDGHNAFQMEVQLLGWPLPVIEQKEMWWDWDDPRLKGPEPDPAMTLKLSGLLLNPLLLGGAVWIIVVVTWLAPMVARRWWRQRHGRCMTCSYPVGTSPVCTECGSAIAMN